MFDVEKTVQFKISNTDDYVSVDSYANVVLHVDGQGDFDLTGNGETQNTIKYLESVAEALTLAAAELKKEIE